MTSPVKLEFQTTKRFLNLGLLVLVYVATCPGKTKFRYFGVWFLGSTRLRGFWL